jgi:hypothetical protein
MWRKTIIQIHAKEQSRYKATGNQDTRKMTMQIQIGQIQINSIWLSNTRQMSITMQNKGWSRYKRNDNPDTIKDNPDTTKDNPDTTKDNPDTTKDNPDARQR